jgi:hypothetical protein
MGTVARPPRAHGPHSNVRVFDLLMFCCVSAFFVGLVVAVTTLPV